MIKQERNVLIDLLKGFAIILVVLGHAVQNNLPGSFDSHPVFNLIYSFHMPLFMFLSGYVGCISFNGNARQLLSRLRTLMLPFWSWFLFSVVFFWAIHYQQQPHFPDLSKKTIALLRNPDRGLWFLWVLFFNYLFLYLSLKINKKHAVVILFVFYLLTNILCVYVKPVADVAVIGWHLLFFLCGYGFKRYKITETAFFRYLTYLSSVFFPVMVFFWSRHNTVYLSTLLKHNIGIPEMLNYIYSLAVPFAGIFISFAIMELMQKAPLYIQNIFIKTGKISLEIYATHFYFFSLLFLLAPLELHLKIALTFIGVLSLTVAAQWLLKTNKLTAFMFYGKLKR